ncbi:expressed unknown protein [Ectocarpus siliculosus]|uniref:Uncharacterized protein n=1 Tax=Ectocarpus siliculosus TaxID=2880 RepID=D7FKC2_ECTSI|nr:expressed unknown protein [Ectocarpus siliculosus]|eukprot:CBJ29325.1 expressed unknown protein [Ectocarpus siliculosus]
MIPVLIRGAKSVKFDTHEDDTLPRTPSQFLCLTFVDHRTTGMSGAFSTG